MHDINLKIQSSVEISTIVTRNLPNPNDVDDLSANGSNYAGDHYNWRFNVGPEVCNIDQIDVQIITGLVSRSNATQDYFTCAGRNDCPDDVDSDCEDHIYDEVRYFITKIKHTMKKSRLNA